jgi:hypothetical protein
LGTEQGKANIQAAKEINVAEQKVPAEARGKEQAKQIQQQGFANGAYPILTEINQIVRNSTGSTIGASIDSAGRFVGGATQGAKVIAEMKPLAGALTRMIPRFEGAQSDRDVAEYKTNAGDFANEKLPVEERIGGLLGMIRLMKIYDKENANDWNALGVAVTRKPQEKTIDGVTYINDGKGWKAK